MRYNVITVNYNNQRGAFMLKPNVSKPVKPFEDRHYQIDYQNLLYDHSGKKMGVDQNLLDLFNDEYEGLACVKDKVVYLFERIVFDSYIQNPGWWKAKCQSIGSEDVQVQYCMVILGHIISYMESWSPPDKIDMHTIEGAGTSLHTILSEKSDELESMNPIIRIVAYDYLGLMFHKLGLKSNNTDNFRRAKDALERVIALSARYDEQTVKLWEGYATYNLSRVLYELDKRTSDEDYPWQKVMDRAIEVRKSWTGPSVLHNFTREIQEGLYTEYLHAKAEFLLLVDESEGLKWYDEAEREYREWVEKGVRVRLGYNVRAKWEMICRRFGNSYTN